MPMLQVGRYQFDLNSAAYQSYERSDSWRWQSLDRIGNIPSLQFTGENTSSLSLQGVIYPFWKGGLTQLNDMRIEAKKGTPLLVVSGTGDIIGYWVITDISESQSNHFKEGVPRSIEFGMTLSYVGTSTKGTNNRMTTIKNADLKIPALSEMMNDLSFDYNMSQALSKTVKLLNIHQGSESSGPAILVNNIFNTKFKSSVIDKILINAGIFESKLKHLFKEEPEKTLINTLQLLKNHKASGEIIDSLVAHGATNRLSNAYSSNINQIQQGANKFVSNLEIFERFMA